MARPRGSREVRGWIMTPDVAAAAGVSLTGELSKEDGDKLVKAKMEAVANTGKSSEDPTKVDGSLNRQKGKGEKKTGSASIENMTLADFMDKRQSMKIGKLSTEAGSVDVQISFGKGNQKGMMVVSLMEGKQKTWSAPFSGNAAETVGTWKKEIESYFKGRNPSIQFTLNNPIPNPRNKPRTAPRPKMKKGYIPAGNGTITGNANDDKYLLRYQKSTRLTASQEKAKSVYESRAKADPSKWNLGDGVGIKIDSKQINRGFRVVNVDQQTKQAKVRQIADTGITVTGGRDKLPDQWIHVADLIRDKKYNQ